MRRGNRAADPARPGPLLTLYVDTSLLVSALTREAATARVQTWLASQNPDELTISGWVATEFASALSMKMRMGQLRAEDRAKALGMFTRLQAESLTVVPVTRENFATAARFSDRFELSLRSGDALHVAVAAGLGATIWRLDQRLAESAMALGVSAYLA